MSVPKTLEAFAPVVGPMPKILILGTFPGAASRSAGEYYANPRNAFWRVISAILGQCEVPCAYNEKLTMLRDNGVALWDMVRQCETDGSADDKIRSPVFIGLNGFIEENLSIRSVFFNGGNAARFASKASKTHSISRQVYTMPSTSPANARYSYGEKLRIWREAILPFL